MFSRVEDIWAALNILNVRYAMRDHHDGSREDIREVVEEGEVVSVVRFVSRRGGFRGQLSALKVQ